MFITLEYFITQNLLSVIYVCINNVWDAYPNLSHLSVIDLLNSIWQDSHLTTFFSLDASAISYPHHRTKVKRESH